MKSKYWFKQLINVIKRYCEKFAVRNLVVYIVILNAFVYLLSYYKPEYIELLTLNIEKVLKGEIWRLVTYIFIPPVAGIVFIIFALYFLYLIGLALESEWGSLRLNLYYFTGMIGTTIIAILFPKADITNSYLHLSLFLAFATLYPDFTIYLFFIIPVKVKYIAVLSWLGIILNIAAGALIIKFVTLISVLNYFLFFRQNIIQNIKLMHSRSRAVSVKDYAGNQPFHKCSFCEKTENDDSDLEFRVCGKCKKEFCLAHLSQHSD